MSATFLFRGVASAEFEEAAAWYENHQSGLGTEFSQEVWKVIDKAVQQPDRYPITYGNLREALVSRFPYVVYYRVKRNRVVIVAVVHTSRDPANWQGR